MWLSRSGEKELYSTLSLFTQVYKWVPVTNCWGEPCNGLAFLPGVVSINIPRHALCYGNWNMLWTAVCFFGSCVPLPSLFSKVIANLLPR